MKSKLVLLACMGTLALSASAHAAISKTKVPPNAPRSHAVAKDSTAKSANLTKTRANAVGPHAPVSGVLDKR
jgi:hypothetical protein